MNTLSNHGYAQDYNEWSPGRKWSEWTDDGYWLQDADDQKVDIG